MTRREISTAAMLCAALTGMACENPSPSEDLLAARSMAEGIAESDSLTEEAKTAFRSALRDAEYEFQDWGRTDESESLAYIARRNGELALAQADLAEKRTALAAARKIENEGKNVNPAQSPPEPQLAAAQRNMDPTPTRGADPDKVLHYGYANYQVKPWHRRELRSLARKLAREPDAYVTVIGRTDRRGQVPANQQVAYRRARRVAAYLYRHGVPDARLSVVARPADNISSKAPASRALRRTEIVIERR